MLRKILVPLLGVLALLLGGVPAASADEAPAPVYLTPSPVLLTYSGPPPHGCPGNPTICYLPIPFPTLSLQARLRTVGPWGGGAVAGEKVYFSIGAKPTEARPQGSIVLCSDTTTSAGWASCEDGKPTGAALLAALTGGGWVSHPATAEHGFAVEQVPLVAQACSNPFC